MGCKASTAVDSSIKKRDRHTGRGDNSPFMSKYSISMLLQKGEFTQVYSCKKKTTNEDMAVKVIKVDTERQLANVRKEEAVWKYLGEHKNIVVLLDSVTENHLHHFVMESCEESLWTLSSSRPERNTECGFLNTFQQVLQGLFHCHSMNVVHRDVKPANILLDVKGSVKLCDFGISVLVPEEGLVGISGTAPFMSPEMLQLKSYGLKTDIWSCGASAYMVLYGECPYQCMDAKCPTQVMEAIAKGSPKPRWQPCDDILLPSARLRSFVQALLERNTRKRPTVEECLQLEVLRESSASSEGAFKASEDEVETNCSSPECSTNCTDLSSHSFSTQASPHTDLQDGEDTFFV